MPELQELKFGCEVMMNLGKGEDFAIVDSVSGMRKNQDLYICGNEKKYEVSDIYEILGSDIHLEHILLAIEKVNNADDIFLFEIDSNGFIGFISKHNKDCELSVNEYDLSKPFSDQSPDFYSFLLEIIK